MPIEDRHPDPDADLERKQRRRALWLTRGLWLLSLLIQAAVALAIWWLFVRGRQGLPRDDGRWPLWVAAAMLVVLAPLGYAARSEFYKAHWRGHAIEPRGYVRGNLAFFAMLELVTYTSLLAVALGGAMVPHILPAAGAVLIQIVNVPRGSPLEAVESEMNTDEHR